MLHRQLGQNRSRRPTWSGGPNRMKIFLISELIVSKTLDKIDSIQDTLEDFSAVFGWRGQNGKKNEEK
jgi:hypothetical protein